VAAGVGVGVRVDVGALGSFRGFRFLASKSNSPNPASAGEIETRLDNPRALSADAEIASEMTGEKRRYSISASEKRQKQD
jgi:hypothetical protein